MSPLWITLLLAPTVVVRGHARITLDDAALSGGWLRVAGSLRDRDLLTALSDRDVVLEIQGEGRRPEALRTGPGGAFEAELAFAGPVASVVARFAGDGEYLPDATAPTPVEADVAPRTLHLRGPAEIRLAERVFEIEVEAREAGASVAADVQLENGAGAALASVRTGAEPARVEIATRSLGPPGPVRVVARSGQAVATIEALLRAPVEITLEVSADRGVVGDRLAISGRLRDERGAVADAPVSIRARGLVMASLRSDAQGEFASAIDTGSLGEGELQLEAVYAPHVAWREAARSPPRSIRLLAPRPLPIGAAVAPIVALGAALLVRRAAIRRRARPAAAPVPLDAGLRAAGASLLRRRYDIDGKLWDPFAARPIAGATLAVSGESASVEATSDADGGVRCDALPAGRYTATAAAAGYVTLSTELALPHRGELSGFVLNLEPVRAHALRLWRARAAAVTSRIDHLTPAEIAERESALHGAARAFEAIFYSGKPHAESALAPLREGPTPSSPPVLDPV